MCAVSTLDINLNINDVKQFLKTGKKTTHHFGYKKVELPLITYNSKQFKMCSLQLHKGLNLVLGRRFHQI